MTDYSDFLARLNDKTAEHGEFIAATLSGESPVWFRDTEGSNLTLAGTLDDLVARVRGTIAEDLWPALPTEEASMNLFSVHLYEALESGSGRATWLTYTDGGLALD